MEYTQADRDRLIRIEDKLDAIIQRIEDVEHDLYGNGRKGLIADHVELRTVVNERTDPKKAASIASVLTGLITLVGSLIARQAGV